MDQSQKAKAAGIIIIVDIDDELWMINIMDDENEC